VARTAVLGRLTWQVGEVVYTAVETPRVRTLTCDVPGWRGHRAGQHVDVRLTAEDGYQTVRSYSIASPPENRHVCLTVERLDDGEVSPFLVDDVRDGDRLEFRGPIGGYFVWDVVMGGPLFLVAGGSGIVPLMAMTRHRVAAGSEVSMRLLVSSRSAEDAIYRAELDLGVKILRQKSKGGIVEAEDSPEMPFIECQKVVGPIAMRENDDRSVGQAERLVRVPLKNVSGNADIL
jgi:ferredoxin-NADP reductase